jgi:hypothetical protein
MHQDISSFPAYFSRFHRYAKESGWNDTALISRLIESLNSELRSSLVGVDLPETLEQCANQINKHYNDILRLTHGGVHKSLERRTTNRRSNDTTRTSKDPNAMEINAVESSYALVGSAERERRRKKHLCFKCGSSKHISPDCKIPIPTARIRTALLNRARQPSRTRSPRPNSSRRPRSPASSVASSRSSVASRSSHRLKGKSRD